MFLHHWQQDKSSRNFSTNLLCGPLTLLSIDLLVVFIHFRFGEVSEWCGKPAVKVAVTVDAHAVVKLVMERLIDS